MSRLVESCIVKSEDFLDLLRLLALDYALETKDVKKIMYVGSQKSVAESLLQLCKRRNLAFNWKKVPLQNRDSLLRKMWNQLPNAIRSLIWLLRYLFQHWSLRGLKKPIWFEGSKAVFVFSYFAHIDKDSCESGSFYSRQWEVFPELLRSMGKFMNWTHLFLFSKTVPDIHTGISWLKSFNRNSEEQGSHVFLDTFLDFRLIIKVLSDWARIQFLHLQLGRKIENSLESQRYGWLWPILKKDWYDSMTGVTGMNNILLIHLFDRLLSDIPHQEQGYYLSENQSWERAFVNAWRKHSHGRIIAVAHSTIRYWDLRYYDGSMTSIIPDLPKPDVLAVNGSAALLNLQKAGYPMEQCVRVEALRYLYLNVFKNNNGFDICECHAVNRNYTNMVSLFTEAISTQMP